MADQDHPSPKIVIIAPLAGDAAALASAVEQLGHPALVRSLHEIGGVFQEDPLLIIVTEEALIPAFARELQSWAARQPEWSALPILVLVANPNRLPQSMGQLLTETNGSGFFATTLARPVAPEIFSHAVHAAVGSRRRQFRIRDQIEEIGRAHNRIELLAREIGHRAKNNLQMLSGLLHRTLRQTGNIETAVANFESRLAAMGRSVSLLDMRKWNTVGLDELITSEITALASDQPGRIDHHGPPIKLDPDSAMSVQMLVHELTTNAIKYGALSVDSGRVDVNWEIDTDTDPSTAWLTWCESGGPTVTPPDQTGFGSQLMEAVGEQIGGTVAARYEPSGLNFRMEWPQRRH